MNLPALPPRDIILQTAAPNTTVVVKAELQEKVGVIINQMVALPEITDNDSFQSVRNVVRAASALKKEIEAQRQIANTPFAGVIAQINAAAQAVAAQLDAIITEGKFQETHFLAERDRKIAEENARLRAQEAAARLDTSRPTAPLPMMQLAEKVDAPVASRPDIEVFDPKLVPDEYKVLDMVKIRRAVLVEGKEVGGVRKVTNRQVVAR